MAPSPPLLESDLDWLKRFIHARCAQHFNGATADPLPPPPPLPKRASGGYADTLRSLAATAEMRLVLLLALAPHLAPELLDPFLLENRGTARRFTEFGGWLGGHHSGFLPTVETALFLLAGRDHPRRLAVRRLFHPSQPLLARGLLQLSADNPADPPGAARLTIPPDQLELLLDGDPDTLPASEGFPAERLSTPLGWDDLILDATTADALALVDRWLQHAPTLLNDWGLARRLKPGFRCLFHGPPGTGKTLSACLLGQRHQLPVYRVDLSRVVSKWVGETEKNLATLFDRAQHHNWILFFDEAEALFSRRSEGHTANDRHANQQIAYLLQRLEDYPGLVILATNLLHGLDAAFARRFQACIHFPQPDAAVRLRLWQALFGHGALPLAADIELAAFADRYDLAGGAILNVLRHAALLAVARSPAVLSAADLHSAARSELRKQGRFIAA
ncbi:MAG: ATP-binding protein [Synechococcaceae cyanobacterium]